MAKKNTLTDLSDYLNQNPNEIDLSKTTTKEDFVNRKPNSLVDVPKIKTDTKLKASLSEVSIAEIAAYLHEKAKEDNVSFAELWMKIIDEGAKIDPLLKNASALGTIRSIRKTSFNVVLEGISQAIKNKK
tara:strand:- start:49 stop:438 length:390 start_codon:yes stop_codon:yes gene_type:complete